VFVILIVFKTTTNNKKENKTMGELIILITLYGVIKWVDGVTA